MNKAIKSISMKLSFLISILMFLLAAVYITVLIVFRIPNPMDIYRMAIKNPWTIDSIIVRRIRYSDYRDKTHSTGCYYYGIETYCFNETSLPFTIMKVGIGDNIQGEYVDHINQRSIYIGEYKNNIEDISEKYYFWFNTNGNVIDCCDSVLRGKKRVLITGLLSDSSQSYAENNCRAQIDKSFDDHNLSIFIHTSRGSIVAKVNQYKTREEKTNGEWYKDWVLPTIDDLVESARKIAKSYPDSAIALLSTAIIMDDLREDAYQLLSNIYESKGDTLKAEEIMFNYRVVHHSYYRD